MNIELEPLKPILLERSIANFINTNFAEKGP